MDDLSLEVRHNEITVTRPKTGHTVTYRKDPSSPMLVARDPLPRELDAAAAAFLIHAWKATYSRAKTLGWL
jgi:hypothetical protein